MLKPPEIETQTEWRDPPIEGILPDGEVHIWRSLHASFPGNVHWAATVLSHEEEQRANRFHRNMHRHQYIYSHWALRTILSLYCNIAPEKLRFIKNEFGKPYLQVEGAISPIQFNLSYCHGMSLVGITKIGEIGVDVEQRRKVPEALQIAKHYFSEKETRMLNSLSCDVVDELFLQLWTRTEACAKAAGTALSQKLHLFDTTEEEGGHVEMGNMLQGKKYVKTVDFASFSPGFNYYGAVAVEQFKENIHFFEFKRRNACQTEWLDSRRSRSIP